MSKKAFIWLSGMIAVFLAYLVLFSCTRPRDSAPEAVFPTENTELSFVKWEYDGWQTGWKDTHNLTGAHSVGGPVAFANSNFLIDTYAEYEEILDRIQRKEADMLGQLSAEDQALRNGMHQVTADTLTADIDEAFFADHKLAVLDFCWEGALHFQARLDRVEISGSTWKAFFTTTCLPSTTACQPGFIYWIPVPRDCASVEADFDFIEWQS